MGRGGYHGGSTIVGPRSDWFSGNSAPSKDLPASAADLAAGARLKKAAKLKRASDEAENQKTRKTKPTKNARAAAKRSAKAKKRLSLKERQIKNKAKRLSGPAARRILKDAQRKQKNGGAAKV